MDRFMLLTNRYIIVEFMSKGVNKYRKPKWYTLDWFAAAVQKSFKILHMKEMEGRIVIIGERKKHQL